MVLVLDASVTGAILLPDEGGANRRGLVDQIGEVETVAPRIWWFEARNLLIINERRRRLDWDACLRLHDFLTALPVGLDDSPDALAIFDLARRHRLTFYDASYLELAVRRTADLATLDAALGRAAAAEGIAVIGP